MKKYTSSNVIIRLIKQLPQNILIIWSYFIGVKRIYSVPALIFCHLFFHLKLAIADTIASSQIKEKIV